MDGSLMGEQSRAQLARNWYMRASKAQDEAGMQAARRETYLAKMEQLSQQAVTDDVYETRTALLEDALNEAISAELI